MIKVSCEELRPMISKALPFVATRTTMPILKNFLFYVKGKKLFVEATDTECHFKSSCDCEIDGDGDFQFCAQADAISKSLSNSKSEFVKITLKGNSAVFTFDDKKKCELATSNPEEYPREPELSTGHCISVESKGLVDAMRQAKMFAMKNEGSKYTVNGVNMLSKDGLISISGTDTRGTLSCELKPKMLFDFSFDVIIPHKSIGPIVKSIGNMEECVDISFSNNKVVFSTEKTDISSGTLSGKFPPVEKLLNKFYGILDKNISVDSVSLNNALGFARNSIDEESVRTTFEISTGQIKMYSQSETGYSESFFDFPYEGDDVTIEFDSSYMVNYLSHIDDVVSFMFGTSEHPIILKSDKYSSVCFISPMYTKEA